MAHRRRNTLAAAAAAAAGASCVGQTCDASNLEAAKTEDVEPREAALCGRSARAALLPAVVHLQLIHDFTRLPVALLEAAHATCQLRCLVLCASVQLNSSPSTSSSSPESQHRESPARLRSTSFPDGVRGWRDDAESAGHTHGIPILRSRSQKEPGRTEGQSEVCEARAVGPVPPPWDRLPDVLGPCHRSALLPTSHASTPFSQRSAVCVSLAHLMCPRSVCTEPHPVGTRSYSSGRANTSRVCSARRPCASSQLCSASQVLEGAHGAGSRAPCMCVPRRSPLDGPSRSSRFPEPRSLQSCSSKSF
ncbi:hypothetical protein OH76DRAFT_724156 [Lentinus brumalis]|uniref:Uncharacterized protein n=1 Tax=Lentinus brumalis TaxID=2498619 RepID=A0A371D517_9APHY|nr:hypothetical protein OH76DRAFT_724156 [Polyporus brumalis]